MKRITIILLTVCALLLAGCTVNIHGCNEAQYYYKDAEKYSVGNFTYSAADINSVSVNWIAGKVTIVESDNETLSVSESKTDLKVEEQIHYLIENGQLTIHFQESGYKSLINISGPDPKDLTVEIPVGVTLDVNLIASDLYMGTLSSETFEVATVTGNVTVDAASAKSVKAETVSGNITINKIKSPTITVETVSGAVNLNVLSANSIDATSVSGGITLSLNGMGARVDFETTSGSYHQKDNSYLIGDGSVNIDVETVSGSLSIN